MRSLPAKTLRFAIIAACSAIVATGCVLDRSPLPPGWGRVQPAEYCPGDTLTASYDFLGSDTCATTTDCTPYLPTVTLNTASGAFPSPTSLPPGYTGTLSFPAVGDSVTVGFHSSANPVTIPTDRFEGSSRVFLQRTGVNDINVTARRMVEPRQWGLTHTGLCSGSSPTYASGEIPGGSRFSPNMRVLDICNTNGVPIMITLSGTEPGSMFPAQMVDAGRCLDLGAPGMPAGIDAARIVDVRPVMPDLSARCSAAGPNNPPATLTTVAHLGCR